VEARPHILIVDDSADVTGALRVLFEETGNDVSVANTIRDAVAVADARIIDVMLLDLTLPDGDGLTVLATMHDLTVAGEYADRLVLLADGRVVADGPPDEALNGDRIRDVFAVEPDLLPDGPWTRRPSTASRDG